MSGFSPEWLTLREPFDAAARSRALAQRFAEALPPAPRIADLGGGTGSNVRYLAPLVPGARWRVVDADPVLLAEAAKRTAQIETLRYDLNGDLRSLFGACDGVVTSALLDLTSAPWLDRLGSALALRQLPFLAALSVDGRIEFDPPAPHDRIIVAAFAQHQRGDKGFGSALGLGAIEHLATRLQALGYEVVTEPSDWRIGANDQPMLRQYLDGVIGAAIDAAPERRAQIASWSVMRRQQASDGALSVRVGHRDILATYRRRRA
jgi:hypothetical protein